MRGYTQSKIWSDTFFSDGTLTSCLTEPFASALSGGKFSRKNEINAVYIFPDG